MNPKKFAIKCNPPRLCLIYDYNGEGYFHEFLLSQEDLTLPTQEVYQRLNVTNPGYLEGIDQNQILSLIDKLKKPNTHNHSKSSKKSTVPISASENIESQSKTSKKPTAPIPVPENPQNQLKTSKKPTGQIPAPESSNQKKNVSSVEKYRNMLDNLGITVSSDEDSDDDDNLDFGVVEKTFKNSDSDG
ncbi:hypothetical protein SteCoe_35843 [Stentor coeruleus]|uniref:Uncharacterized protein n=1 Tax=Stentor coeruleus TaxID=5963 RepID=A0A1R2ARE2_9CILI|nr:hypothetical protein SteCoe_35843 [Stentor coeruleus]